MAIESRYIRKTLMPDEKVLAEGKMHYFYTFSAYLWFAACVASGFAMHFASIRYLGNHDTIPIWFMLAVGFAVFVSMMMKKWTTEIFLTTQRLIYKRGLFIVDIDEVDIEQMASDQVRQSLMGRIFGYGGIHVVCIQAADLYLPDIAHPYTFRNAIESAKKAYRHEFMDTGRIYKVRSHPHPQGHSNGGD